MYKPLKTIAVSGLLLILLFVMMMVSIGIGQTAIDVPTVFAILTEPLTHQIPFWSSADETIIMSIRLPRAILGALVGATLAISGAALQSLFRNPMADPFILGISNGAALGATLVMVLGISVGLGIYNLPAFAFAFALITIFLVYNVAKVGNQVPVNTLLLSGIAISAFLSAISSFVLFTGEKSIHQVIFWTMGGLSGRGWDYVWMILPFTIIGVIILLCMARNLNALMFGEESAQYLGIEVEKLKKILLVVAAIITGAAVAVSGVIGFVGLIIPHVVRLIVGPDHRILLPTTVLFGAVFLLVTDMIARTIIAPAELPIGVITAMFGAPFFLYLLRSKRGEL